MIAAFTVDTIADDPIIYKKVKAGDYTVVLALTKILLQYAFVFLANTIQNRYNAFNKCLVYIAIDEVHLIWDWTIFEKKDAKFKTLRYYFLKVLMMRLLVMIMPNILDYIGESFHL